MCIVRAHPSNTWFLLSLHGAAGWLVWGWVHGQDPRAPILAMPPFSYRAPPHKSPHLIWLQFSQLSNADLVLDSLNSVSKMQGGERDHFGHSFGSLQAVCVWTSWLWFRSVTFFPSWLASLTSCLCLPALCIMHCNQVSEALLTPLGLDLWRKSSSPTGSVLVAHTCFFKAIWSCLGSTGSLKWIYRIHLFLSYDDSRLQSYIHTNRRLEG